MASRFSAAVLCVAAIAITLNAFLSSNDHHRANTKIIQHHSLHPPHLRDTWGTDVPHWNFFGSAVVSDEYVRLTPDRQSQVGSVWNTEPLDLPQWEVMIGVRVHSKSSYGADGLAFWVVDQLPPSDGPLFGHPMKFKGIGVLFDSYDNDRYRDNPAIHLLYNDGSDPDKTYEAQQDFRGQAVSTCYFDFRNTIKPNLAIIRVRYDGSTIQVFASKTANGDEFLCATANNVELTSGTYFFGLTAETGGISDHHDVHFVHTYPVEGAVYDHDVYQHQPFDHIQEGSQKQYWRAKTPEELAAEEKEKEEREASERRVREERAKEIMEQRKIDEERQRVLKLEAEVEKLRKQAAEQAAAHDQLKSARSEKQAPQELTVEDDQDSPDEATSSDGSPSEDPQPDQPAQGNQHQREEAKAGHDAHQTHAAHSTPVAHPEAHLSAPDAHPAAAPQAPELQEAVKQPGRRIPQNGPGNRRPGVRPGPPRRK